MSTLEHHLLRITENAESISSLYFRPPGTFTNALLLDSDLSRLIRDPEPIEQKLFHTQDHGSTNLINTQFQSMDELYSAVIDITDGYPIPGLETRLERYKQKANELEEKIERWENVVESQRKKLDLLSRRIENEELSGNMKRSRGEVEEMDVREEIESLKREIAAQKLELERQGEISESSAH